MRKALQGLAASGHPFRGSLSATAQAQSPSAAANAARSPFRKENKDKYFQSYLFINGIHYSGEKVGNLAPVPIMFAGLKVLHVAGYTTRNWSTAPLSQVKECWEALHPLPEVLANWWPDAETFIRLLLTEHDSHLWAEVKLLPIFEQELKRTSESTTIEDDISCSACSIVLASYSPPLAAYLPKPETLYAQGCVPVPNFGWFCSQSCAAAFEVQNGLTFDRNEVGNIDYYTNP